MADLQQDKRIRFGPFEFEPSTGELTKNGQSIRLQGQPARLLGLLASRPGQLVTRAEIREALWPDGRFVEFEHAINTAMKKVREALEDDSVNPKFVETLPKLGYRFTTAVEEVARPVNPGHPAPVMSDPEPVPDTGEDFSIPHPRASRFLFLLIQIGYLAMYCTALYYMPSLERALTSAGFVPVSITLPALLVVAMCGIAVRLYLVSAVGWRHPAAGTKFLRLFPFLLVLDSLWAAAPLLAVRGLNPGLALAATAAMAYLPFAQRTLIQSIHRM